MLSQTPDSTTPDGARCRPFRWLRFSIRGLVVTVAVLSLALSHVVTSRRLRQREMQLEALRNDVGYLTVQEPGLIHAIAVPSYEHLTFRWRMHLPANRAFVIRTVQDQLTQDGIPSTRDDCLTVWRIQPSNVEREFILTFAVRRDHTGQWGYVVEVSDSNVMRHYALEGASWLDDVNNIVSAQTGRKETVSETPEHGLPLLRVLRETRTATGGLVDDTPRQGVLLWISEEEQ